VGVDRKCFFQKRHPKGEILILQGSLFVKKTDEVDSVPPVKTRKRKVTSGSKQFSPQTDDALFLATVVSSLPGHVYWLDKNGTFLGCNERQAEAAGVTPDALIGKTVYDFLPQEQADIITRNNEEVLRTGALFVAEERASYRALPDNSGEYASDTTYLSEKVPLKNHSGETIGLVSVSLDIGDRKRVEQKLTEAKERAEIANQAKSEFLAVMSHELRTPLNGIMGMAQVLAMRNPTPEQKEYIDDLYRAGSSLLSLISDVLDFSKLEAGKLEFVSKPFDLLELVEDVVSSLSVLAKEKNLDLLINYHENVPRHIVADARRMRQILINLVGNAIKFTEQGHILLAVDCISSSDRNAHFKISVRDTGIGIPEDKLGFIFERFSQLEPAYRGRYRGTGLGLAIVKQMIETMGGSIDVQSELGQGTLFCCELSFPLQDLSLSSASWQEQHADMRALIVDDNLIRGEVICKQLSISGSQVVSSEMALEALVDSYEEGNPYQLIIIDDRITFMDALNLGKTISTQPKFNQPILVLLAQPGPIAKLEKAKAAGYNDCLIKPIQPTEMISVLTRLWEQRLAEKHTDNTEKKYEPKVLLVEDNPLNQKIAKIMLEDLGCKVYVSDDGVGALSLLHRQYDLIFMDIGLGEMDGYAITSEIRRREINRTRVPIIAMTAHALESDRHKCLEAGMDDVLIKPVNHNDLRAILSHWIASHALSA
jgi:two-component system sensor histidine kinase/response regulator